MLCVATIHPAAWNPARSEKVLLCILDTHTYICMCTYVEKVLLCILDTHTYICMCTYVEKVHLCILDTHTYICMCTYVEKVLLCILDSWQYIQFMVGESVKMHRLVCPGSSIFLFIVCPGSSSVFFVIALKHSVPSLMSWHRGNRSCCDCTLRYCNLQNQRNISTVFILVYCWIPRSVVLFR